MRNSALEHAAHIFPLPAGWVIGESIIEDLHLSTSTIHLAGLSAIGPDNRSITGSAGSLEGSPISRAYFELVERACLLEAQHSSRPVQMLGHDGKAIGWQDHTLVFQESQAPERWKYALSNGVAFHQDLKQAMTHALEERVERHLVLSHWYLQRSPRILNYPASTPWMHFDRLFDFEARDFGYVTIEDQAIYAVGVFAFPLAQAKPMVMGYGAAESQERALEKAWGECLQRIGFLWECEIEVHPVFSPTPHYHQEMYLGPIGVARLRGWLSRPHFESNKPSLRIPSNTLRFLDLTSDTLKGKAWVVRADCEALLPLVFGRTEQESWLHPIF